MKMQSFLLIFLSVLVGITNAFADTTIDCQNELGRRPLALSVLSGALLPGAVHDEEIRFLVRPERERLLSRRSWATVRVLKYQQSVAAPLVFLVAGAGGTAQSPMSKQIGEKLYAQGYNVVSLPNPVSCNYSAGISATGRPGDFSFDVAEFYNFMVQVRDELQGRYYMKITDYRLVGFSLGAIVSGLLHQIDSQLSQFQFSRLVLIKS